MGQRGQRRVVHGSSSDDTCSTRYGTARKQTGKKKEQAIDSTARRDAIIWVVQAVRTATVVGTLPIYLGTKTSLYVNINMSLDQSFSTECAYQNKHVGIDIYIVLFINGFYFIYKSCFSCLI